MADNKKCANPACVCIPTEKEKYCSAHCEGLAGKTEIMCGCGHPHCTDSASTTATASEAVL